MNPGGAGDLGVLLMDGEGRVFEPSEEEDDFFFDVEAKDVVREAVAGGRVEDDIEVGFFADLAEGGFEFGFAGFDVAFREAGEAVLLGNDKDGAVFNDDSAAGFLGGSAGVRMLGIDGLGVGEVRGRGDIHTYIIYDMVV